ncbi:MAG: ABC transporter ATP-binding protein [Lachnospiraceae bacterium]|nr:ABC transporter ATP-binding protein [Lachnospiraceae bacterium]
MIRAEHLTFSYGRGTLIRDVQFEVRPGECLVLTGPNGSGKSTLLALIAGAFKPQGGSVRVEGALGMVPQGTALFEDMTVEDNLLFFAGLNRTSVPAVLPFGLEQYRKKRVASLSGGSQKRVSIACALLGDPANLLLDEPCAGLDIAYRGELAGLIEELKKEGRCLIYVAHEPAEYAAFFDKLLFLGEDSPRYYGAEELAGATLHETADRITETYRALCEESRKEEKNDGTV